MRALLTFCFIALVWSGAATALAQSTPSEERARAREIFRELIEIPTTAANAATTRAAEAMASRLVAFYEATEFWYRLVKTFGEGDGGTR